MYDGNACLTVVALFVQPGYLKKLLPESAPQDQDSLEDIFYGNRRTSGECVAVPHCTCAGWASESLGVAAVGVRMGSELSRSRRVFHGL